MHIAVTTHCRKCEDDLMPDIFNKSERSKIMSRIRGTNTTPEMIVRHYIHNAGFRYRLHAKDLPGKPDIVLPRHKSIILVNGCFWHHHHNCKRATIPKTNKKYWKDKIQKNVERDLRNRNLLLSNGWRVLTVWECSLSTNRKKETNLSLIIKWLLEKEKYGNQMEI